MSGILYLIASGIVFADDRKIEEFFGSYIGHAESSEELGRDMSVTIGGIDDSTDYFVKWSTVIHKSHDRTKRVTYNIRFTQSKRKSLQVSAMARDVFGKPIPLDPLKGDPLFWARIKGDTHTVYAMIITDDGGFDLQVYNRTLTEDGLSLEFIRQNDDQSVRKIHANLIRVSN
ncbi:hypothetical protein ADIMK_3471 [Marinobacterium lacunae]|uniref:Uncharacterized protein n=1 Tax=Marinobacterium lacunae TaxID=1232683 RepID=A0A081FUX6_9GAMM|nr:hypothetical protein [Marinobacterium lacunae]KEA62331.1 hypothetical protein ADIMK_3471 [Marinobacterium lacunae]MBR9882617.1 hypothetical protein [Oceanospirillales bacterium]